MVEIFVALIAAVSTIVSALISAYMNTRPSTDPARAANSGGGSKEQAVSTKKLMRRMMASIILTFIFMIGGIFSDYGTIWYSITPWGFVIFGCLSIVCIFRIMYRYFLILFW